MTACKEVILSAGSFNTPQLLMLSGIGDKTELTKLGINTRVNLPSVGKNLTDHILLPTAWRVNNNQTTQSYYNPAILPQEIQEWNQTHKGPLAWTVLSQMAWLRLPPNDPILKSYGDPSPGPTSAHYQLIWGNGWASPIPRPNGTWLTIQANLVSPTSRKRVILFIPLLGLIIFRRGGEIRLNTSDPFNAPIIDHNALSTDYDIKTLVAAAKAARRFLSADAWKGFIVSEWEPLAAAKTDEELVLYARNYSTTYVGSYRTTLLSDPDIVNLVSSTPPEPQLCLHIKPSGAFWTPI